MVLSKLTSRLPDSLRGRLPGRPGGVPDIDAPDVSVDVPGVQSDDESGPDEGDGGSDRLSLVLTVLTLAGLGLATVGVVARLVLDRMRGRETTPAEPADDIPLAPQEEDVVDIDADSETAVESDETDSAADEESEAEDTEPEDGEESEPTAVSESTEDTAVETAEETIEPDSPETTADDDTAAAEQDADTAQPTALAAEGDDEEEARRDEDTATSAGPPRIAPLVGMVALVGIRLLVKKLGGEPVEA